MFTEVVNDDVSIVLVFAPMLVVDTDVIVVRGVVVVVPFAVVDELTVAPTPTQYAYSAQKLVVQSFDTAGFHLRKFACEMRYFVSIS